MPPMALLLHHLDGRFHGTAMFDQLCQWPTRRIPRCARSTTTNVTDLQQWKSSDMLDTCLWQAEQAKNEAQMKLKMLYRQWNWGQVCMFTKSFVSSSAGVSICHCRGNLPRNMTTEVNTASAAAKGALEQARECWKGIDEMDCVAISGESVKGKGCGRRLHILRRP